MAVVWHPVTCCQPEKKALEAGDVSGDDIMLFVEGGDVEDHDAMRFPQYVVSQISNLQSTLLGEHEKVVSLLRAENRTLRKRLLVLESHSDVCWPGAGNAITHVPLDSISTEPLLQEELNMMLVPDERETEPGLHLNTEGASELPKVINDPLESQTAVPALTCHSELMKTLGKLETQQESLNDKMVKVLEILSSPSTPGASRRSVEGVGVIRQSMESASRFSTERQSRFTVKENCDFVTKQLSDETEKNARKRSAPSRKSTGLSRSLTPPRDPKKSLWRVSRGNTREWSESLTASMFSSKNSTGRPFLHVLVHSNEFIAVVSMIIFSYAIFIAAETELLAIDPGRQLGTLTVFHAIYSFLFSVELLIRLGAEGCSFCCGRGALFNWFDTVLVVSILLDLVLAMLSASGSTLATAGSLMRTLRIIRIVRTMRLVRTFRHMHEFQKMAFALGSSFKTLLCSMLVVFFVMFFFAVIFTQGAADSGLRDDITDLDLRFGGLVNTLHTCFLSVSNGLAWDKAYRPLYQMGPWFGRAFVLYICISLFGVLNVVTSIFVESVIRSAQHHRDVIVQDKEKEKYVTVGHMQEVFRQMDLDGSGQVTSDELEYFLSEPDLRKYMEALDVSPEDTRLLFSLLDRDGSNSINIDEFCGGCLRLKGNARSIDMHALILQMKNFLTKWADFTDFAAERFDQLSRASETKSTSPVGRSSIEA